MFEFPWTKAARIRAERIEREKIESRNSDQLTKFSQLEKVLKSAAANNELCNVLNGETNRRLSKMKVTCIPKNGTWSSAFCGMNTLDSVGNSISGRFVTTHQFNIDTSRTDKELHFHCGAYGEDRYWALHQWEEFLEFAARSVQNYRMYPA